MGRALGQRRGTTERSVSAPVPTRESTTVIERVSLAARAELRPSPKNSPFPHLSPLPILVPLTSPSRFKV